MPAEPPQAARNTVITSRKINFGENTITSLQLNKK
jgi:hypothetical protein